MLFLTAAALGACPSLPEALGGDARWTHGGVTIEGRFSEGGVTGHFVQYERPEGIARVRTFDHGAIERYVEAGAAPEERWLVEAIGEPTDVERCGWALGGRDAVELRVEEGLPRLREGSLACSGDAYRLELSDWRPVDGAPFPHRLVGRLKGHPVFLEMTAERVTRGTPEGAFAPADPSPFLEQGPSAPVALVSSGRPYVEAVVIGPSGRRRGLMLLDTGWTQPALTTRTAQEIGLTGDASSGSLTQDAAGRTVAMDAATLSRLEVADGAWVDLPVKLVDWSDDRLLGVLGNRLFEGQVLEIRASEATVHWRSSPSEPTGHPAPYCASPQIQASVAGRQGLFVLDTGAFIDIVYAATDEERDELARESGGGERRALEVVSGGAGARTLGPADVALGGHRLSNATGAVLTRSGGPRRGLIGWSTLRCFDSTLDFGNERASFDLVGDPDRCAVYEGPAPTFEERVFSAVCVGVFCVLPVVAFPLLLLRRRRLQRVYDGEI